MKTTIFIICILLNGNFLLAQNITNTLGTSGTFTIKSSSTNFLTLSQSTGNTIIFRNIELGNQQNSTLSVGVLTKNGTRFMHNFAPAGVSGYNTFLGTNSGNFTMSGTGPEASFNNGIGAFSLFSNTTGTGNTAMGYTSLYSNTNGFYNTAVGYVSLSSNIGGTHNTAFGYTSLSQNVTGNYNTALGSQSLYNNLGSFNTSIGTNSQYSNSTGSSNVSIGVNSMYGNMDGYSNTAVGSNSGSSVTSGYNLTLVGNNSQPSSPTAANQITLGDANITSLRCNVTSISSLSDRRDKKNITDLSLGLDFIAKLKPRQFNWDKREWYDNNVSDGSKMQETPTAGFIAQELDDAQTTQNADWLNLVLKDNPEKLEATYGNLLPVMVKAIQELNEENQKLKNENQILEERLAKLEEAQNRITKTLEQIESKQSELKEINISGVTQQ